MLLSTCCQAEVMSFHLPDYYICDGCGKVCDVEEVEE